MSEQLHDFYEPEWPKPEELEIAFGYAYMRRHWKRIRDMLRAIPVVGPDDDFYTYSNVLVHEQRSGKQFFDTWRFARVLLEQSKPVSFWSDEQWVEPRLHGLIIAGLCSDEPERLHISEIVTNPTGQGYGQVLMNSVPNQANADPNIERVTLLTNAREENEPIQHFYQSFGFEKEGLVSYPTAPEEMAMRMVLDLT